MKKFRSIGLILLFACSCLMSSIVNAQEAVRVQMKESGEAIELFADRSLYLVNEDILFKATYSKSFKTEETIFSSVIYAELIRWNGSKIAQTKLLIHNNIAEGQIQIPADVESGIYYLRAYTRWMRNFSPYSYTYLPVTIVNPYSAKTQVGPKGMDVKERVYGPKIDSKIDFLSIEGLHESYGRREEVLLDFKMNEDAFEGDYSITVCREAALDSLVQSFSFIPGNEESMDFEVGLLPETRGLSLSGKLREKGSGEPLGGVSVQLSTLSKPFYYSSANTSADGSFLFNLPAITGDYDFNLKANPGLGTVAKFLIDADFCNKDITLPYLPFALVEDRKSEIISLARNMEIAQRFYTPEEDWKNSKVLLPFYGPAERVIYEKDFIELENFREFLFELVYEFVVRYQDDKPLIFVSGQSTLSSYPALVLLDNVEVKDIEDLLKVNCRRIDRLEIVKKGFVLGNNLYGGILSIYSEGRDMAGIKPGESSTFFNLSLLNQPNVQFPVYKEEVREMEHFPDRRNTLYWKADAALLKENPLHISFYTGDSPGKYTILIRGIRSCGKTIYYKSESFIVE